MTTTTSAPFADLAAALRGDLVTPGDEGYDAARAVYNGMIDKRPAAVARCRDTADVIAAVAFARAHGLEIAVRGGGHHAAGFGTWDDALVVDLSPMRSVTVDPEQRTVRVDAGCHLGRRRPRHRRVRAGHPVGIPGLHRGGRPDPRRRHRLPVAPLRPHRRQPARRRRRPRRRPVRHRERRLAPGPVLGPARRWWQLRRRHLVHLPLPPDRRERHGHRRSGALRHRRRARGDALVPRAGARAARGAVRLAGADHDPARPAVPRAAVGPQGVRHRVVLHRPARPGRGHPRPGPGVRVAAGRGAARDAVHGAAVGVRPALPGRAAVVLARRLLPRDQRRRHRGAPRVR